MVSKTYFEMDVNDVMGIFGRGIVFKGKIRQGVVGIGDKLEYSEDDGARISAIVKKIVVKDETRKTFGIFKWETKEIPNATQGQEASVMVGDFFNVSKQCKYTPRSVHTEGGFSGMSKTKLLRSFVESNSGRG